MDAASAVAIANLLAQLLPLGINIYNQIEAANQNAGLQPLADILAAADVNYKAIQAAAVAQFANKQ